MASRRLRLLNALLRHVVRPRIARTRGPGQARRDLDRAARLWFRQPPYLSAYRDARGTGWVYLRGSDPRRVILYFHGGGYVAGGLRSHQGMLGRLSKLSGLPVCVPDYRLAPQARFPAAFDDAMAAWRDLLDRGHAPEDIVLGGDSAGGGLMLALLARLCAEGMRPRAALAFSPWTDLTCSGASLAENAARDPLLPPERSAELVALYLGDAPPDDPRASPLFARFDAPPPVLFQVSESEILRDDTLRMADRLRAAGGDVTVQMWPDTPHVWQIGDGWVPEARAALRQAAEFVQAAFAEDTR